MFGFYFLKDNEQVLIESLTGRRVINGPGVNFISPINRVTRRKGLLLTATQYVVVENQLTGEKRIERGPKLYFLGAQEQARGLETARTLGENEYLLIRDEITGEERIEQGPTIYFPSVNDVVVSQLTAITLKKGQYVRILNRKTGAIRVEQGEARVILSPNEEVTGRSGSHDGIQTAINIDELTAVLIRDLNTGQLSLVTEKGRFVPQPHQEIVSPRKRIVLEDHQAMVIKTQTGRYVIRLGTDAERSFFLDPYAEVVSFAWSAGIHKDSRSLGIEALDLRPKFMWYEFEARTQDNVELVLGITFFWQITDVEAMIRSTDDTTGDICSHARSRIIQAVSQVTLEQVLAQFNVIVGAAVLDEDDPFYRERGSVLHAVEVRAIQCKDEGTQEILNEIIQETTNRLNRLQKQTGENEVRLRQMEGEIEAQQARQRLIELQRANEVNLAAAQGEAESARVAAYLRGIGDSLSDEAKIALFNLLRKGEILHDLSQGSANLYFTPNDVNLSIESGG